MSIFELFEQLIVDSPELFVEAEQYLALPIPGYLGTKKELTLYGPQLEKIMTRLKSINIFKDVDRMFFTEFPKFIVDKDGIPIQDSPTILGSGQNVCNLDTPAFKITPDDVNSFTGDVYLYNITIKGIPKNVDTQYLKQMKSGAILHKIPCTDDRVLIIKYDPAFVSSYTKLKGTELLDRISGNVGNNIAELIHADESTIEQEKIAFIRLATQGTAFPFKPGPADMEK